LFYKREESPRTIIPRLGKFFSSAIIHYSQSLPSLIVRSEFRNLLGPKFTRKFGFLHRIANSTTFCLLNSPLEQFFGSIQ
jgi:hypothetical protein